MHPELQLQINDKMQSRGDLPAIKTSNFKMRIK